MHHVVYLHERLYVPSYNIQMSSFQKLRCHSMCGLYWVKICLDISKWRKMCDLFKSCLAHILLDRSLEMTMYWWTISSLNDILNLQLFIHLTKIYLPEEVLLAFQCFSFGDRPLAHSEETKEFRSQRSKWEKL